MKILLMILMFVSCVHLEEENNTLKLEDVKKEDQSQKLKSEAISQLAPYKYDEKEYVASWIYCKSLDSVQNVMVMHGETNVMVGEGDVKPEAACDQWDVQTFLKHGYNVILPFRPGFYQSTGDKDFIGPHSIETLEVVHHDFLSKYNNQKVDGIWGYGEASIAAALIGRKLEEIQWLILGGGMYDMESLSQSTKDATFKKILMDLKTALPSALSYRSIAFEIEGLPKKIYLYHGQLDEKVPLDEMKIFEDTLTAMEIDVKVQTLEKQGHNLPELLHRAAIEFMLDDISGKSDQK